VVCNLASLGVNTNMTFTINVQWTVTGPVYASVSVAADQVDSAPASGQKLAFGLEPAPGADAPLPQWAYALLGMGLMLMLLGPRRAVLQRSRA
jgi:hypothetical protein